MKKILLSLSLIIFSLTLAGCRKTTPAPSAPPTRKVEAINQLPVADRPFVNLYPQADGRTINFSVDLVKNATNMEYELEYSDDQRTFIEGAFGRIDFQVEPAPATKAILLGTCSKSVCRYHEGVSGGSLTLRFSGGSADYVLKTDFNLQTVAKTGGNFTAKDGRATLAAGKTGLPASTYVMVAGTMGLPAGTTGEVLAGPYSFLAATSPALKSATITIQSKDDLTGAKLMYWNGKTLTALKTTVADGKISAPATGLGTFLVIK